MDPAPTRYVVLEKPVGQTPLEAIDAWKAAHPAYAALPATYAGRLDPMASGALLVLLGEECKRREEYLGLDKEYEIEVVLGLSTDTGDALGLARSASEGARPSLEDSKEALSGCVGAHTVPYPAFSSKTVAGKPLFMHALEGSLGSLEIPTHEETVYRISLEAQEALSKDALYARIAATLRVVPRSDEPSKGAGADFRQGEIRERWRQWHETAGSRSFLVLRLRVVCASGTYMRTLAARLARALGTDGFALSIRRTKIGRYVPLGPFGFWRKHYR